MSTGSRDILDDFDNPYKRDRRNRNEVLERDPDGDGDLFSEEGEEIVKPKESESGSHSQVALCHDTGRPVS